MKSEQCTRASEKEGKANQQNGAHCYNVDAREMRVQREIESFFRYYFLYIYQLVFVLSL